MRLIPSSARQVTVDGAVRLTGHFDTGSTTWLVYVNRSSVPFGERWSHPEVEHESIMRSSGETFLDETAEQYIASRMMKVLDAYATTMQLP